MPNEQRIGGALMILAIMACGGSTDADDSVTRRDSMGLEIVESTRPRWDEDDAWRVDTAPSLSIGTALDGNPAMQFTRVSGVTRLSDGRIAVVDDQTAELRIFDASGRHLTTAGGKGGGPGDGVSSVRVHRLVKDS